MRKALASLALAAALGGCVTAETVRFTPIGSQQVMMRDGRSAIISQSGPITVVLYPIARTSAPGERPTFVAAIQNSGAVPVNFTYSEIRAQQISRGGPAKSLHVYTVDELQAEARANQVVGILLVGALAAAGTAAAANDPNPYSRAWNTGVVAGTASGAATSITINGELNIAALEATMLKDNTVLPGEWYGGVFQIQGPAYGSGAGEKAYQITFMLGGVPHTFNVSQVPAAG